MRRFLGASTMYCGKREKILLRQIATQFHKTLSEVLSLLVNFTVTSLGLATSLDVQPTF